MNSLRRNKRYMYLCKLDKESDFEKYQEPIKKAYNYNQVSQKTTIENTGMIGSDYIVIIDINYNLEDINIGDRLYVKEPVNFDFSCINADYKVVSKSVNLNTTEVVCVKLIGDNY